MNPLEMFIWCPNRRLPGPGRWWSVLVTARAACFFVCVLLFSAAADAQDGPLWRFFERTAVSGGLDGYYAYNSNAPAAPCAVVAGVAIYNCLHAFDVSHNSFSIGLADLALEKTPTGDSRAGFRIELGYGPTAALTGAQTTQRILSPNVLEGYVSYLASGDDHQRLQIDVGKFFTHFGPEEVAYVDNWNSSRSLLFALAIPWEFIGVRVDYHPTARFDVTGFLVDGWSGAAGHGDDKRVGFSVSARPTERVTIAESFIGGPAPTSDSRGWRNLSDTVVTGRVTDKLSLAWNYDIGQDRSRLLSWDGNAVYLRYQITDWLALSPRIESLRDHDGFMTGEPQDLQEFTMTTELRPSRGSVFRIEYRIDVADKPYFLKDLSGTERTQGVVAFSWAYGFSTKAPMP
jgi:hypothetical protein